MKRKALFYTKLGLACACMISSASAEAFTVGIGQKYPTISSALRKMRDGDVCIIKQGVYRETLTIPQNKVTLRAEGRVVITGCDDAGKGAADQINGVNCLRFDVGKPVYDAFGGSQYLQLARFPNKSQPMTSNEDWAFSMIEGNGDVRFTEKNLSLPKGLNDGYILCMGNFKTWFSLTLPITAVEESGLIHVDANRASSGYMGGYGKGPGIGYIIGAKAALDAAGEWYSDGKAIWIVPPAVGANRYELRTRLDGLVITGDGVRLENLRFHAATARVEGDDAVLSKCAFDYISPFRHNPHPEGKGDKHGQTLFCQWGSPDNGTAGVFVQGDRFVAENCRFAKSWWCGLMLRGNQARIENCLVEDINWMARRSAAIYCWGDDSVVRHCTLRNLGGTGIEGGNTNFGIGQYCKRNVWEHNYIENVCNLVVDQGVFYVNHQGGERPPSNSIWRYNVAKTARGPKKGGWTPRVAAYYVDNSSSGFHIHNNIAVDVINPIKHNDFLGPDRAGRDIWYYNNTFLNCGNADIYIKRGTPVQGGVNLVNNLSVAGGKLEARGLESFVNNPVIKEPTALKNPQAMEFTPIREDLKTGGAPVMGKAFSYVGAVDPAKGMWLYGADLKLLPEP